MRLITLRSVCTVSIIMLAGCQYPEATFSQAELDAAEAEVSAQLQEFWDVWQASSFDEGMAYYSGHPDMSFVTDGFLWESKAAAEAAYRPFFEAIERQEMNASETRVSALTPEVVHVTQTATYTQYFRSGEVSPARDFAMSMTWVKEGGEWKALTYHFSMANPAPANLKSVNLFNIASEADEAELSAAVALLNAGIQETGFQNAGYNLWKMGGSQDPDASPLGFDYLMEGIWPDQAAYDEIHAAEAYLAAGEASGDVFERILADRLYSRFVRINVGGPGEG